MMMVVMVGLSPPPLFGPGFHGGPCLVIGYETLSLSLVCVWVCVGLSKKGFVFLLLWCNYLVGRCACVRCVRDFFSTPISVNDQEERRRVYERATPGLCPPPHFGGLEKLGRKIPILGLVGKGEGRVTW